MKPHYEGPWSTLYAGDCLDVMRRLDAESIDAIVTDPPAGIGFMNREWDHHKGGRSQWIAWMTERAAEAWLLAKPGAHAFVWALPRTSHWTATAWEDAGWEVRDRVAHLFGGGFPKSLDVSKALDRAAGAKREVVGTNSNPATELALKWEGWGTALKPAAEDWWLLRKPLSGTVAANVAQYGTGALNIDAGRIPGADGNGHWSGDDGSDATSTPGYDGGFTKGGAKREGRWPPNVVLGCACETEHDVSCAVALLDAQSGRLTSGVGAMKRESGEGYAPNVLGKESRPAGTPNIEYGDTGGASRFFYVAKASRAEREAWGRLTLPPQRRTDGRAKDIENPRLRTSERVNVHPTVKPLALMEWLIKLITPPGGLVLDPFCGSGSTLVAAKRLGFRAVGIDADPESVELATQRIAAQWDVMLPLEVEP